MEETYEKKHVQIIRETAAECVVLLKKDGHFPLRNPGKIAAVGNGVRYTIKGGTGSGEVNSKYFINIEQGLKNAGFVITSDEWLDNYDIVNKKASGEWHNYLRSQLEEGGMEALFSKVIGAIRPEPEYDFPVTFEGNTGIYVLSRNSGESHDRTDDEGDIKLTTTEIGDILAMARYYENFMLILNTGGLIDLSPVEKEVPNILILSQLGVPTGDVLADVLLGKANPSGHLTMTWASLADYPTFENFGEQNETRYKEGIFVGYRYFETLGKETIYPFGYGLSYTDFHWKIGNASREDGKLILPVTVENIGSFNGKDLVQIYVSKPCELMEQPLYELCSFQKTKELAPGESECLSIDIDIKDLVCFQESNHTETLLAGEYVFYVGKSSHEVEPVFKLQVQEAIPYKKLHAIGGTPDFRENSYLYDRTVLPSEKCDLPSIVIDNLDVETVIVDYSKNHVIEPFIKERSNRELALLSVGAFAEDAQAAMIGNSAFSVVGAAGETTLTLKKTGVDKTLVLADGPQGLRLSRQYGVDEFGTYPINNEFVEHLREFVPEPLLKAAGFGADRPKRTGQIFEQNATAIPIGSALAQSFNQEVAVAYGDIVGTEMERFGVNLWLAPAMNIMRDPRCGRNFEYYSEDPFLSGKIAAAITKGVQKHKGCGVTIKHFCCNNQETNRTKNNSSVGERTLREIYLKGFGICIEESKPLSVMSSYNLLNGIHTAEHEDLMWDYLRCEKGFDGIVMTDWISGGGNDTSKPYRISNPVYTIKAQNDICMPGAKEDADEIENALEKGVLRREEIERTTTRIYQMIERLNK